MRRRIALDYGRTPTQWRRGSGVTNIISRQGEGREFELCSVGEGSGKPRSQAVDRLARSALTTSKYLIGTRGET